jgi:hypothetical protein
MTQLFLDIARTLISHQKQGGIKHSANRGIAHDNCGGLAHFFNRPLQLALEIRPKSFFLWIDKQKINVGPPIFLFNLYSAFLCALSIIKDFYSFCISILFSGFSKSWNDLNFKRLRYTFITCTVAACQDDSVRTNMQISFN